MNNIITRGLGKLQSLVTRGYGGTLIVIKGKDGTFPVPYIPYKEVFDKDQLLKHIHTKKIRLPGQKKDINVDVLLINYTGNISIEAYLKEVLPEYKDIRVYVEGEVKVYD